MKIEIKNRFTNETILSGEYESIKDCLGKNRGADLWGANLRGADLEGADLEGAYLKGAYLEGADLEGAYLKGAKNYLNSHAFFQEVVRQQKIDTFTQKEWSIIGQIVIHRLCWDTIKKRFAKSAMGVFKKLKKAGFGEWEKEYKDR